MRSRKEKLEREIDVDPQHYSNGRFARLHAPEGNPIELWQPVGRDAPS